MGNARLDAIFSDVLESLRRVIREHRVTEGEWRLGVAWLTEAGTQPNEIPLLLDVHLGAAVDEVSNAVEAGTENTLEGPFYVPGAPLLTAPYVLPMRPDEPGERLVFSGTVRSTGGAPLAGAVLDVWHISADGGYSHFHAGYPDYNLRGRLATDEQGRFEVLTVVPQPYEIPKDGATGRMSGRARDGRLVHFAAGLDIRPGDVVECTVTYAAPHHLNSDAPLVSHRRTPAGDLFEKPAGVMLGMPSRMGDLPGRPAAPGPTVGAPK